MALPVPFAKLAITIVITGRTLTVSSSVHEPSAFSSSRTISRIDISETFNVPVNLWCH